MINPRPEILLVEDSEDDAWIARRAFRRHRMEQCLVLVRSGEEAIQYLRSCADPEGRGHPRPRVVFLDLDLPGIHGCAVLEEMRADEQLRKIPVVIVSSSTSDADVRRCYRLGANSFVVKRYGQPQPGEYVVEMARYWLDLNEPER